MTLTTVVRIAGVLAAAGLVVAEHLLSRRSAVVTGTTRRLLLAWSFVNLAFIAFLIVNHVPFPLNLDLMEGTVLQHFSRAAAFEAIYPAPTAEYVAFAYNPLYYVLAVPFGAVFGVTLPTLRIVSVLGYLLAMAVVFAAVRRETGDRWWATVALGLFVAAYYVMDSYLDTAHSDAWFLATALLGTETIARSRTRRGRVLGVALLATSFWFKQHGSLFTIGGVLYLTWRERDALAGTWPYWTVAAVLGPGLYLGVGPMLFGSHFHYFTYQVGSAWTQVDGTAFLRFGRFLVLHYGWLLAGIVSSFFLLHRRTLGSLGVWQTQLLLALASGVMGALDPGSADQVFIPVGTWMIVSGTIELRALAMRIPAVEKYHLHHFALAASFALFLYNPTKVICDFGARQVFADLVRELESLDAKVWAPSVGQLSSGYRFRPAAHWVALEDMVRGPGKNPENHPRIRALMRELETPDRATYVLSNEPLDGTSPAIAYLAEHYVLVRDYEERFEPLRVLPGRWDHGWPRYLYRHRSVPPPR